MFVACGFDMNRCITIEAEEAVIGGTDIEFAIAVLTDVENAVLMLLILKIALDMVAVPTPQSLVVGDDPQIAPTVLHQAMDGVSLAQALVHLAGFIFTIHLQHTMT